MDPQPPAFGLGNEDRQVKLHLEAVSVDQRKALSGLAPLAEEAGFYLAGGTAVALLLGHRRSVDLDFFCTSSIESPLSLADTLRRQDVSFETVSMEKGTLHGSVSGVRTSFIEFRYPLLRPLLVCDETGSQLASLDDLGCMKLAALAQRGAKKDFLDVYAIGREHRPLLDFFDLYQEKFSIKDIAHLLYSLAYFDDAESEPMPEMIWKVDWPAVKETFRKWLTGFVA